MTNLSYRVAVPEGAGWIPSFLGFSFVNSTIAGGCSIKPFVVPHVFITVCCGGGCVWVKYEFEANEHTVGFTFTVLASAARGWWLPAHLALSLRGLGVGVVAVSDLYSGCEHI